MLKTLKNIMIALALLSGITLVLWGCDYLFGLGWNTHIPFGFVLLALLMLFLILRFMVSFLTFFFAKGAQKFDPFGYNAATKKEVDSEK